MGLSDSSHSAYFQALGADLNSDWRIRESGENPLQPRYSPATVINLQAGIYCHHCSFRMGRSMPALRSLIVYGWVFKLSVRRPASSRCNRGLSRESYATAFRKKM